jgi:Transmembrane secretion effector
VPQPLLRIPGFTIYLSGRFIVGLINRAQVIAVGYHIYEITDDPLALGYVGLSMFVPMVGFGLFAGDVADRFNRGVVLTAAMGLVALSSAGLLALALNDVRIAWPYYASIALFGAALSFARPAMPAFIAQIVPPAQLSNGIALSSGTSQIAAVIGPAAIGVLLIPGPAVAYATLMAVALIAALMWLRLTPYAAGRIKERNEASTLKRIAEGICIVMRTPLIFGVMTLDLFAVFLGSVVALLPVFARDILMVGPAGLGLLRAAPAVGAALMALVLARIAIRHHAGTIMLAGVAVFGAAILVFGLSRSLALSLVALAVSGAADMLSNVLRNTTIQLSAPDAIRGRVNSVSQVFVSGSNELGDFRAGLSAGLLGTIPAVMIGGFGTLAVAGLWSLMFPSVRKLDRLSDLPGNVRPANERRTGDEREAN